MSQTDPTTGPTFEDDVKPLFRDKDREAMEGAFDLWDLDDVREHSAAILEAVESGGMPCDGAWTAEQVAVLRAWVDAGMPE